MLHLRLYVTSGSPNSLLAEANLKAVCAAHFELRHRLEIVDLLQSPELAERDAVIVTPTLLKISPPPAQRLVGTLADHQEVFATLAAE
jgi:circadian clock protein KaiB